MMGAALAAAPVAGAERERPRLSLIGAVGGTAAAAVAIFSVNATQGLVRLKIGGAHDGWILRSVKGREAILQKGGETVVLALGAPSTQALDVGFAPGTEPGGPRTARASASVRLVPTRRHDPHGRTAARNCSPYAKRNPGNLFGAWRIPDRAALDPGYLLALLAVWLT